MIALSDYAGKTLEASSEACEAHLLPRDMLHTSSAKDAAQEQKNYEIYFGTAAVSNIFSALTMRMRFFAMSSG